MTETLGDTLRNVVANTLVDALDGTLPEVEPELSRNTLANVMTQAQINALADTLAEVRPRQRHTSPSADRGTGGHDA